MTNSQSTLSSGEKILLEILPLEEAPKKSVPADRKSTFKMPTNPADATSVKVDFTVNHITGTSDARELTTFMLRIRDFKDGMGWNLANDDHMSLYHTQVRGLLHGSASNAYENGVTTSSNERRNAAAEITTAAWVAGQPGAVTDAQRATNFATNFAAEPAITHADIFAGFTALLEAQLPFQALQKAKRYLRRHCRKPATMTIRHFVTRIRHINEVELPMLHPMSPANSIPTDEVMEILFYAIPNSWRRKLQEMDVDVTTCTDYATFIQRVERVEEAEKIDTPVPKKSTGKTNKSNSYIRKNDEPAKSGTKFCLKHGNGNHSTDECTVLKRLVEGSNNYSKKGGGKSSEKTATKRELNALVAKGVKKELKALAKKRKEAHFANKVEVIDEQKTLDVEMDDIERELEEFDFGKLEADDASFHSAQDE